MREMSENKRISRQDQSVHRAQHPIVAVNAVVQAVQVVEDVEVSQREDQT